MGSGNGEAQLLKLPLFLDFFFESQFVEGGNTMRNDIYRAEWDEQFSGAFQEF